MQHIYGYPHSKKAEFYKLLLDYDKGLERDLADCGAIWYESGTQNLMAGDYGMSDRIASMIISKNFGFIERLVENDKIDLVKFSDKLSNSNGTMEDRYRYLNSDFGLYHTLLMLLSISDTPIKDLISYLK